MGIRFNRETLRDKIYACWLGKNIGGTMGAPYEGQQVLNDIQGFVTPKGSALANDDLDLQLVWLMAMNDYGPDAVDSKLLGEYWTQYIGPNWNEYGVCKANMREGLVPPLSGSVNNGKWMNSNGAWIRTEIWACTHPGCVEKAIRLAFEDASVDHGFGEGSYAAIFVAAMESAGFVISDLRALLRIGLSKIPADCRVARSVNIVIDAYENGVDWKEARSRVIEDSADLGWFQAPANIAFTVLGLLYGEGDFKKSMILAINCGDDTDCTGATLGSLMGIMGGSKAIPEDWASYIGDNIVTCATVTGLRFGNGGYWPNTCTKLTDAVLHLIPSCTRTELVNLPNGTDVEIVDGPDDFGGVSEKNFLGDDFVRHTFRRSPYSFVQKGVFFDLLVEFDEEPRILPNGELKVRLTVNLKNSGQQDHFHANWYLPEGWQVKGSRNLTVPNQKHATYDCVYSEAFEMTIVAGENVDPTNKLILSLDTNGRPFPMLVPVVILG